MGRGITTVTLLAAAYLAIVSSGCVSISKVRDDVVRKAASEGKIIADLHTHPSNENNLEALVNVLSSGVVGLAAITSWDSICKYEDVLTLPEKLAISYPNLPRAEVREINPGRFAEVRYDGKRGFVVKCQEIMGNGYHLLAIGIKDYIPNYTGEKKLTQLEEIRYYVDRIHEQGGLASLAHPCIKPTSFVNPVPYKDIPPEDEPDIRERMEIVDVTEVNNMLLADVFVGVARLNSANIRAQRIATECQKPGIVVTDSHNQAAILCSGIAFPDQELTLEKLFAIIREERNELVINHYTFGTYLGTHGFLVRRSLGRGIGRFAYNTLLFVPRTIGNGINYICPQSTGTEQQAINTSSQ